MIKPNALVALAQKAVGDPYWYGTYGAVGTLALLRAKIAQYPDMYTDARVIICKSQVGRRVWDCVGLIKGNIWDADFGGKYQPASDLSADGMFARCPVSGPTSTLPEIPGIVLHKAGHIGIYEGAGKVIEARGFAKGVIRSSIGDVEWTGWGYCHLVDYSEVQEIMLQKGDKGPAVVDYQKACKTAGYNIGAFLDDSGKPTGIDGSFGNTMVRVTSEIQTKHGLPLTGIVDAATYGKLAEELVALTANIVDKAEIEAARARIGQLEVQVSGVTEKATDLEKQLADDKVQTDDLKMALRKVAAWIDN